MSDHVISRRAATQLGLVTRRQLLTDGVSPSAIDHRVGTGRLRMVHAGVFAVGGVPDSADLRRLAACLVTEPPGVVSHRSAAAVHGVWGGPTPDEITVEREHAPRIPGVVVHRSRDLRVDHVNAFGPLPVTDPLRTLVDLGQVTSWVTVSSVLDRMLGKKLVTIADVRAALVLHGRRGRRGVGALRRAMELRGAADDLTESVLEATLLSVLRRHDVPEPALQVPVFVGGRWRRLDMGYPSLKIALEADGYEPHSTIVAHDDDRVRGNELLLAGWSVAHFTHHHVVHQPTYVVSTVMQLLRPHLPRLVLGK